MGRGCSGSGRSRWLGLPLGLLLVCLVGLPPGALADDVVPAVRAAYEAGDKLFRQGDRGSLEKALRLLDTRKDEALASVDYWELYARVWLGLKKDPSALWDGIVTPRRDAAPRSPVFDLVQARLATDSDDKRRYLEQALTRSVKDLRAKVAMADFLLDEGEEDEADALLVEVLDTDPNDLGALLAKARLAISDGLPGEAVEFLQKALVEHETARLHHLLAQAYRRQAQDGADVLEKALASAAQAVGLDPSPEHVETFVALLKETGDAATATKALREHFERTRLPLLGALLAESAFRAGDYEAAVLGLEAGGGRDLGEVKGLAVAYARLGKAAEARQAARRVLSMDSRGLLFAAEIELWLGGAEAVQKRLGSLADPAAQRLLVRAYAWSGDAGALGALARREARDGARDGEDVLAAWLQAQVLERLGASGAEAVRGKLLQARFAAGRRVLAQGAGGDRYIGEVKTAGWPRRAATYLRGRCGRFLEPASESGGFGTTFFLNSGDEKPSVAMALAARSTCGEGESVSIQFNRKASTSPEGFIELFREQEKLGDFAPAEEAFKAACAACVDGKTDAAVEAFSKALTVEPGWYRARVFRAVIRALASGAEKRDEARDAAKALEDWPDDFQVRRLVIFLRAWADDADLSGEIEALAEREAQYNVRDLAGL